MAEDLKGLIEKINQEGVRAAQEKARDIENQARGRAEEIIKKAHLEAERLMAEAKDKILKMQAGAELSLKQTGRDILIALRKEINAMLERLILTHLRQALSAEEMAKIITALIKNYPPKEKGEIVVSLNKEDLEILEKGLLGELKEEIKKGVVLKASEDIAAGFVISYDAGKSHFDFSDQALSEYIGTYLEPKLNQILKGENPKEKRTTK